VTCFGRLGGWDTLSHETYEELVVKERRAASNEFREPDLSTIPEGGYIIAKINRGTIGAASLSNFEAIVIGADGAVLERFDGDPHSIPEVPGGLSQAWWDLFVIPIRTAGPAQVFLLDKLADDRCGVNVRPGSSITKARDLPAPAPSAYVPQPPRRDPPPSDVPAPEPKPTALTGCTYAVQSGDTWAQIATWHEVGSGALIAANAELAVNLADGTTLQIPRPGCPSATEPVPTPP
jgi:hypothetical protein